MSFVFPSGDADIFRCFEDEEERRCIKMGIQLEPKEEPSLYKGTPNNPSSASQPINRQVISKSHASIVPTKSFTYEEIVAATGNFSRAKSISRGAFSKIYRAKLLNTEVTVKKFAENNESGFLSEILAISRTNHPNIVRLIGYCIHESTRMLVLEFIPNNTLDFHLYGGAAPNINWKNRMKIALGVAKGLAYLHEDCDPVIIHRNIKSTNVVLDFDFEPKIADFDFAINTKNSVQSHIATHSLGTGYMFPDYSLDNKHFNKSDVSSFGLVLLGLITGTKPSSYVREAKRILPLLKKALIKKKYEAIADATLGNQYVEEEMGRMIGCAASCIYKSENFRPKMKQIVEALGGEISMEVIWQNKNDWRYLRPLEADRPLEQIWDEDE